MKWDPSGEIQLVEEVKLLEFVDLHIPIKRDSRQHADEGGIISNIDSSDHLEQQNYNKDTIFVNEWKLTLGNATALARAHRLSMIANDFADLPWPTI